MKSEKAKVKAAKTELKQAIDDLLPLEKKADAEMTRKKDGGMLRQGKPIYREWADLLQAKKDLDK